MGVWGLFLTAAVAMAGNDPVACPRPLPSEPVVRTAPVSENRAELEAQFLRLYESGERLKFRAYKEEYAYVIDQPLPMAIPESFLTGLTRHIEAALHSGFADFVFYSDLGHGHLYLPNGEETDTPLNSPNLKVLYHSAELLKMRDGFTGPVSPDPWLARRYFNRNILAGIFDLALQILVVPLPDYNTVREIEGHREVGTFLFSASKDGCFAYRDGKTTRYFDLSFSR